MLEGAVLTHPLPHLHHQKAWAAQGLTGDEAGMEIAKWAVQPAAPMNASADAMHEGRSTHTCSLITPAFSLKCSLQGVNSSTQLAECKSPGQCPAPTRHQHAAQLTANANHACDVCM